MTNNATRVAETAPLSPTLTAPFNPSAFFLLLLLDARARSSVQGAGLLELRRSKSVPRHGCDPLPTILSDGFRVSLKKKTSETWLGLGSNVKLPDIAFPEAKHWIQEPTRRPRF
ncbi:hypothetical protein WG66_004228 [Moniliophthora roreri]|nr:hypothetical protein WG66_004228 [Moniliophthora roreri]